jgi:hypothetical protein
VGGGTLLLFFFYAYFIFTKDMYDEFCLFGVCDQTQGLGLPGLLSTTQLYSQPSHFNFKC